MLFALIYPKCGKAGHTLADCWKKKRDQQSALLKKARRFTVSRDETWKKGVKKLGKHCPGDNSYTTCHNCRDQLRSSSKSHKRPEEKEQHKQSKRRKIDWNRYIKRDKRDISSEDWDEVITLSTYTTVINRVSSHSCIQVDQHELEYSWRVKGLGNIT